jgi:hypothetical protein
MRIIRASIGGCLVLLLWSGEARADKDPCSVLSVEEVSQTLGDTFDPPVRTFAPAETYKGSYVSCLYTGKALSFEIKQWQFPLELLRERNLKTVAARYQANTQSSQLPEFGPNAWFVNDLVDRIDGPYETYLAIYPTDSGAYGVNRRDKLVALAKLYFDRI